jgi:hypothetical protein
MKLKINKNYKKAKKVHVPGSENIWFQIEPILKREKLKDSCPAVKAIQRGGKTEQEFNSEIFFENQFNRLMVKVKNFGGIEDEETGKELSFSKENLKMLLESAWDFPVCERTDKKGEVIIDEDTGESQEMGLGEWLYKTASETAAPSEVEVKN